MCSWWHCPLYPKISNHCLFPFPLLSAPHVHDSLSLSIVLIVRLIWSENRQAIPDYKPSIASDSQQSNKRASLSPYEPLRWKGGGACVAISNRSLDPSQKRTSSKKKKASMGSGGLVGSAFTGDSLCRQAVSLSLHSLPLSVCVSYRPPITLSSYSSSSSRSLSHSRRRNWRRHQRRLNSA